MVKIYKWHWKLRVSFWSRAFFIPALCQLSGQREAHWKIACAKKERDAVSSRASGRDAVVTAAPRSPRVLFFRVGIQGDLGWGVPSSRVFRAGPQAKGCNTNWGSCVSLVVTPQRLQFLWRLVFTVSGRWSLLSCAQVSSFTLSSFPITVLSASRSLFLQPKWKTSLWH